MYKSVLNALRTARDTKLLADIDLMDELSDGIFEAEDAMGELDNLGLLAHLTPEMRNEVQHLFEGTEGQAGFAELIMMGHTAAENQGLASLNEGVGQLSPDERDAFWAYLKRLENLLNDSFPATVPTRAEALERVASSIALRLVVQEVQLQQDQVLGEIPVDLAERPEKNPSVANLNLREQFQTLYEKILKKLKAIDARSAS